MKEIVVISGKGGTGKTSLTASFAWMEKERTILADCDVDAADMHLLFQPDFAEDEHFYSGAAALIDSEKCTGCGTCIGVCHFDAINYGNGFKIETSDCEGCGYCYHACPEKAISMVPQVRGKTYISSTSAGIPMVHAHLYPGEDNSGKLVVDVKQKAKKLAAEKERELVVVDGSPGVGCPVVASLSGADFVLLVTEPTVSGLHDLKRVHSLVERFGIRSGVIINKWDLNRNASAEIEKWLCSSDIPLAGKVPYDEDFAAAITEGVPVIRKADGELKRSIEKTWNETINLLKKG